MLIADDKTLHQKLNDVQVNTLLVIYGYIFGLKHAITNKNPIVKRRIEDNSTTSNEM